MRSRKTKVLVVLGFVVAAVIIIVAAIVIPLPTTSSDDTPSSTASDRVKSGQTEFIPVSPAPLGTIAGVVQKVDPATGQITLSCDLSQGAENTVQLNGVMKTPTGITISSHTYPDSVRIQVHGDNGTQAVIVNSTMAGAIPQEYLGNDYMGLYLATAEYGAIESVHLCGGGY